MPQFEFICGACGNGFELLVPKSGAVTCPHCGSQDARRVPSPFAVSSAATRKASLRSARRTLAKERRDKAIAEHEEQHHHHDD
jgi:putative FmdB family regulatory protein